MQKVILFDLDGTLIDSTDAILESFHESYRIFNTSVPSDAQIKSLIGYPLDVMFRELGVSEELKWDYVNAYKLHYRKIFCEKTLLLNGAFDAVIEASKFAKLGIVTTKTAKYSQELMEYFHLMHYFEVLIGRENVDNPKPHKEPIEKALDAMNISNISNHNIWMIGDTWMDIESANNAGINSVAVLSGYDSMDRLEKYTHIVKNNAIDAIRYIKEHG